MLRIYLFSLFLACQFWVLGQNIAVKSFKLLDNDLDALVNYPEIDQSNGEKAALIKMVTTETGFDFGGGQLGIVKVVYKTAEIWVYVPAKLKAITIAHPKLGQLPNRFYNFDIPIVSGKVYLMELVTGTIETTVKPAEIVTQWLAINSKPEGASVFIQEQLVGTTPFSRKYPEGEYNYRLELPRYNALAGKISLNGDKKVLELILKPHFGSLRVTSTPENGMLVYLNDENTGKTTPATLEGIASGEQTVKLMSQWFQPLSKRVTIADELTTTTEFAMTPAYADISVTTNPAADIWVDGKKVGNGTYTTRMLAGIYSFKAEKEKYNSEQKQVTVVAGGNQTIALTLKAMTGTLDVASNPFDANITLNNTDYGTTPNTIKGLLVGNYTLILKKDGYSTVTKTITITENTTTEVNENLPNGLEVTISSNPSDVQLFIDGNLSGLTPKTIMLKYGIHDLKLINGEKVVEEKITISQTGSKSFQFDVSDKKSITITSSPSNVDVYIDDKFIGKTPQNISLNYSKFQIKLVNESKVVKEKILVSKDGPSQFDFDVSLPKSTQTKQVITIPCANKGISDVTFFRANSVGKSQDLATSKAKAMLLTKQRLASLISSKIKSVIDRYVNEMDVAGASEFSQAFENMARDVINQQLVDVTITCEKTFQATGGGYETFIAIEVSKDLIYKGIDNGVSRNKKLEVMFDRAKFKEKFDEEMSKIGD